MTDSVRALVEAGVIKQTPFAPNSRYYGTATLTIGTAKGDTITYVARRFIPGPEQYALRQYHVVQQGDRIDNIAVRYLGDPEQFWQICDANVAMRPNDLTDTVGARVRVTLPAGIPGALP
jgi:hypothetical protein